MLYKLSDIIVMVITMCICLVAIIDGSPPFEALGLLGACSLGLIISLDLLITKANRWWQKAICIIFVGFAGYWALVAIKALAQQLVF